MLNMRRVLLTCFPDPYPLPSLGPCDLFFSELGMLFSYVIRSILVARRVNDSMALAADAFARVKALDD